MCQLSCPGCLQSDPLFKIRTRGKLMSLDVFKQIIAQTGKYLYRIQFYDTGEPFINKHLLEMISLATIHNIGSQVSSNLSFAWANHFYDNIVESGLEHLIIAMDGTSKDTYSQYRTNGRYELVEAGLRKIVELKKRRKLRYPFIEWQFIVFPHNRHEIASARRMAHQFGVDRLTIKYDAGGTQSAWNKADRWKYRATRAIRLNSCLWLWGSLVVDTDGIVRPCCNAGRSEVVGDLKETPIRELWNSQLMKELRHCVRRGDRERKESSTTHACKGCPHIM